MRIINLRVDDKLFKMMEKDKEAHKFANWESYIEWLFNGRVKPGLIYRIGENTK